MSEAIQFVSSNPHKLAEASRLLPCSLVSVSLDLPEVQKASLPEIVREKLRAACASVPGRVIVEDVSLGFDRLGGFPGPYIKWLLECAGGEGLGLIGAGLPDPTATAVCCVGYWDGSDATLFSGHVAGVILTTPRGIYNFGWDSWFVPAGSKRSFGEMKPEEKDQLSHRAIAYRKLARHLSDGR